MRDIWNVKSNENRGVKLHFDPEVDQELKKEIQAFLRWIRKSYIFPTKLNIRISKEYRITTWTTNEKVCGTIFFPDAKNHNPIIRIATRDYHFLIAKYGKFSAGCMILDTISHEITHYYQWLKDSSGSGDFNEGQAMYKSKQIVNKYLDSCFCENRLEPFS